MYILSRPTYVEPGQPGLSVLPAMNQSKSCPVQKSIMFTTAPDWAPYSNGAECGANPGGAGENGSSHVNGGP